MAALPNCSRQCMLRSSNIRRKWSLVTAIRKFNVAQNNDQYCMDLVRRLDYENFLCTLLIPKKARASVFGIRAFNTELAQVRDSVSDKNIGRLRLQFWRDTLDQIYKGSSPQQPVALVLTEAVKRHELTKQWFTRLIDKRVSNLDDKPHDTTSSLEEYGENTISPVLYLTLESLDIRNVHADHAASHVGKAIGIATLLRSITFHGNRRRVYLPSDIMIKHGVSHEDIIRGNVTQAVKDVAYELASLAHTHLSTARALMPSIPKEAQKALLPAVPCVIYLNKIEKLDFDLFHPSLRERNHMLPLSLLKHAFVSKIL